MTASAAVSMPVPAWDGRDFAELVRFVDQDGVDAKLLERDCPLPACAIGRLLDVGDDPVPLVHQLFCGRAPDFPHRLRIIHHRDGQIGVVLPCRLQGFVFQFRDLVRGEVAHGVFAEAGVVLVAAPGDDNLAGGERLDDLVFGQLRQLRCDIAEEALRPRWRRRHPCP